MKITPLQWLLLNETNHISQSMVRLRTGRGRGTVWRWSRGKSYPERADAEKLIELYGADRLDFNGCYEATREISVAEAQALGLSPEAPA